MGDWPEPEVRARPAADDEIPRGCKSMLKLAEANGWRFIVRYARGTLPVGGVQWTEGPVTDNVMLRTAKDDLRIGAVWLDGSFTTAWVHSLSRKDITKVSSTELRSVLKGELT